MDVNALIQSTSVTLVAVAWKVAGAVVLWLVGRWLISFALKLLGRALDQAQLVGAVLRHVGAARHLRERDVEEVGLPVVSLFHPHAKCRAT